MLSRLGQWLTKRSLWITNACVDQQRDSVDECPEYNHDLLDPSVEYLRLMIKISIIAGLVIDLICLKYRKVADILLYYESVSYLIFLLVPNKQYLELS